MTTNNKQENDKELSLDQIAQAIRLLQPEHTPDTVDAVMRHIATLPSPSTADTKRRRIGIRAISTMAAACLIGAVVTTVYLTHGNIQAANSTPQQELSSRIYDIYGYCNNYATEESIESAAYYDDPIIDLI